MAKSSDYRIEIQEDDGEDAVEAVELDDGGDEDLEGVMRDAVAAVEQVVEARARPGDGGEAAPGTEAASESAEVENLRREIADLRDRSVRTLADFDNFRKRAQREQQEVRRYAMMEPLRAFLDVVDNLERALEASGSLEDLKAGVEMILHQMRDLLKTFGVQPVAAQDQAFDPNLHEAVARQEDPEVETPEVVEELQRGYLFQDRLLRPARVKVAVPEGEG